MDEKYPFLDRVRNQLAKLDGKNLSWLCGEIDKSERWLYGISDLTQLQLGIVDRISEVLQFDFLEDYNQWLVRHGRNPLHIAEPHEPYILTEKKVSIAIRITGSEVNVENNMSRMLKEIRLAGEKLGFEIE